MELDIKKARPILMWAWNDKLNTEFTSGHVSLIAKSGFGGFCIRAEGGLMTRYMGDEWFRNISAAISSASQNSLEVWICDDYGYPSGTGNGTINLMGTQYQQKFLRCEPGDKTNDRTIISKDGYHFYYDTNPYYCDLLTGEVTEEFIRASYMPYLEKFPEGITGFISIEPRLFNGSIPWSFSLPALYKEEYGEELLDVLPELFKPVGNYKETRKKFERLVNRRVEENFYNPIRSFCGENGVGFKLLPECEDNAVLLSDSGNSATFQDIKREALRSLLSRTDRVLLGYDSYTLNGIRKRANATYAIITEKSCGDFAALNNYISVASAALSVGDTDVDTVLIDNISGNEEETDSLQNAISILERKHILFDIVREESLSDVATADNGCLVIEGQRYKNFVLADSVHFSNNTPQLLTKLECGGAFITVPDAFPKNNICENENLLYSRRICDEFNVHFFYNNSSDEFTEELKAGTKMLDIYSGEVLPFYGVHKFLPYECLILIEDNTPELPRPFKKPLKTLDLGGEWKLEGETLNSIILDKCDVFLGGELVAQNENVLDASHFICALKEPALVECRFTLKVDLIPARIFLGSELPDTAKIIINGRAYEGDFSKQFLCGSVCGSDISSFLNEGENTLSLMINYTPSEEFQNAYHKAQESRLELSRLTYSFELEPLCIFGDFSVKTDEAYYKLDKNAYRYAGDFSICEAKELYALQNLDRQGFTFFSGQLTLSKTINLSDTQYSIKLLPKGIKSINIEINGQKAAPLLWEPYELDASSLLKKGDNEIKITLSLPLRNLYGPHHKPLGELSAVSPADFYKNACVWNGEKETPWDNNYCFLDFGIDFAE